MILIPKSLMPCKGTIRGAAVGVAVVGAAIVVAPVAAPAMVGLGAKVAIAAMVAGGFAGAHIGKRIEVARMKQRKKNKTGLIFPEIVITRTKDEIVEGEEHLVLNYDNVVIFDKEAIDHAVAQQLKSGMDVIDEYSLENRPKFNVKLVIKKGTTLGEIEYSGMSGNPNIDVIITNDKGELVSEGKQRNEILATLEVMPKLLGEDLIDPEIAADEAIEEKSKIPLVSYARAFFLGKVSEIKVNPIATPSDKLQTIEFFDGLINIAKRTGNYDILLQYKRVLIEQYNRNFDIKVAGEKIDAKVNEGYYGKSTPPIIIGTLMTVALITTIALTPGIHIAAMIFAGVTAYYTISRGIGAIKGFFQKKKQAREAEEFHNKTMRELEEKCDGLEDTIAAVKNKNISLSGRNISDVCVRIVSKNICSADYDGATINLSKNIITSDGAASIAEALKKGTKIARLDLSGNPIRNDGIKAITGSLSENFTITELNYDKISEDNDLAIKKQLAINKYLQGQETETEEKQLFSDKAGYIAAIISKIQETKNPAALLTISKDNLSLDVKVALLKKQIELATLKDTLLNQLKALNLFLKACKQDERLLGEPIIAKEKLLVWTKNAVASNAEVNESDLAILLGFCFKNKVKAALVSKAVNSRTLNDKNKQQFLTEILTKTNDDKNTEIFSALAISDICDNQCRFLESIEESQIAELIMLCLKDSSKASDELNAPKARGIATLISKLIKEPNNQKIVKKLVEELIVFPEHPGAKKGEGRSGSTSPWAYFGECIKDLHSLNNHTIDEAIQAALQADLEDRFACLRNDSIEDFEKLKAEFNIETLPTLLLTNFNPKNSIDEEVKIFIQHKINLNRLVAAVNITEFVAAYNTIPYDDQSKCLDKYKKTHDYNDMMLILGDDITQGLRSVSDKHLRTKIIEICIGTENSYSAAFILSELIGVSFEGKANKLVSEFIPKIINDFGRDDHHLSWLIEEIIKLKLPSDCKSKMNEIVHIANEQKLIVGVGDAEFKKQNTLNYIKQQLSNNFDLTDFSHKFNDETLDNYIDFICRRNKAYKCATENRPEDFAKLYNKLAKQAGDNENYKEALLVKSTEFLKFTEKAIKPWEKGESFNKLSTLIDDAGRIMLLESYLKNSKEMPQSCLHKAAALLNSLLPIYTLSVHQKPKEKATKIIREIITKLIEETKKPDDIEAIKTAILTMTKDYPEKELSASHKKAFLEICNESSRVSVSTPEILPHKVEK